MPTKPAGERIIQANVGLTGVFAATAVYAAVVFDTTAQWVGAATAMTLFAIGVFAFIASYWAAVQRSRTQQIAVSQLYLLLGPAVPARVTRTMLGLLGVQFAVALVTTLARPNGPEGSPGSSLAVGFLVPMLGFGLNGVWASRHGQFAPRTDLPGDQVVRESQPQIGQNAEHG